MNTPTDPLSILVITSDIMCDMNVISTETNIVYVWVYKL